MPLFFLLSGFCLTLAYGKKNYKKPTLCSGNFQIFSACDHEPCHKQSDLESNEVEEIFDSCKFYFRRMTRIMPIYYFCLILGGILMFSGHAKNSPDDPMTKSGIISSILMIQSWINFIAGFGPNPPAWTISTLFFFYIIYPR